VLSSRSIPKSNNRSLFSDVFSNKKVKDLGFRESGYIRNEQFLISAFRFTFKEMIAGVKMMDQQTNFVSLTYISTTEQNVERPSPLRKASPPRYSQ
jgi:hypothetical protein